MKTISIGKQDFASLRGLHLQRSAVLTREKVRQKEVSRNVFTMALCWDFLLIGGMTT